MSKLPTLENDKFEDKAIAAMSVGLESYQSEMTNAVYILVRPIDVLSDESGQHPGESFVQLFLVVT